MPTHQITPQDMHDLDRLLHENGDRTAFYLHYYELTGNDKVLDMAQISHFSGWTGGVAQRANDYIESKHPNEYPTGPVNDQESPTGGVKVFSEQVAQSLFQHIKDDLDQGSGTGVLSERQVLDAAKSAWEANHLGNWFPGNPMMSGEFFTMGTWAALRGAALETIDSDPSRDAAFQNALATGSYHVTEDGKVGFVVDNQTGHVNQVILHEAFHDMQIVHPPVESWGVLNSVPNLELPAPAPAPVEPTPVPEYSSSSSSYSGLSGSNHDSESRLFDFMDGLMVGAAGGSLLSQLHPETPVPAVLPALEPATTATPEAPGPVPTASAVVEAPVEPAPTPEGTPVDQPNVTPLPIEPDTTVPSWSLASLAIPETSMVAPLTETMSEPGGIGSGVAAGTYLADLNLTPAPIEPPSGGLPDGREAIVVDSTVPIPPQESTPELGSGLATVPSSWTLADLTNAYELAPGIPAAVEPSMGPVGMTAPPVGENSGVPSSLIENLGISLEPNSGLQVGLPSAAGEPPSLQFMTTDPSGVGGPGLPDPMSYVLPQATLESVDPAPLSSPLDAILAPSVEVSSNVSTRIEPPSYEPVAAPVAEAAPVAASSGWLGSMFSGGGNDSVAGSTADSAPAVSWAAPTTESASTSVPAPSYDPGPSAPAMDTGSSSGSIGGGGIGGE